MAPNRLCCGSAIVWAHRSARHPLVHMSFAASVVTTVQAPPQHFAQCTFVGTAKRPRPAATWLCSEAMSNSLYRIPHSTSLAHAASVLPSKMHQHDQAGRGVTAISHIDGIDFRTIWDIESLARDEGRNRRVLVTKKKLDP